MKRFLILCVVLGSCVTSALSRDSKCELPLSRSGGARAAKVPPDLADHLLQKAFKSMETSAEEQRKILQDANSGTGVPGLFCAQTVQLTRTGTPQLFIYFPSFCFSQNCPVWVYGHKGNEYELLLEDVMVGEYNPGYPSSAVILGTWTNRYRDIRLIDEVSACESGIRILGFDGKRYRARVCMTQKCAGAKRWKYKRYKCDTQ